MTMPPHAIAALEKLFRQAENLQRGCQSFVEETAIGDDLFVSVVLTRRFASTEPGTFAPLSVISSMIPLAVLEQILEGLHLQALQALEGSAPAPGKKVH